MTSENRPRNEFRDSSGQLVFGFHSIPANDYTKVTADVVRRFGLSESSKRVNGLDELMKEFRRAGQEISLEWDIWTGYTVVTRQESAESLGREVADYIDVEFYSTPNQRS